jgi:hypothetical protein
VDRLTGLVTAPHGDGILVRLELEDDGGVTRQLSPSRWGLLASDLARSSAAWSTPAVIAAKKVTTTIPMVTASSADAVGAGLVTSLPRPAT